MEGLLTQSLWTLAGSALTGSPLHSQMRRPESDFTSLGREGGEGLRSNLQPREEQAEENKGPPSVGLPIPLACLFLTLQLASRMWSRQTHPAADWPASSWCETLWPVSTCQSTPRAPGWRRESRRPTELGEKWAWRRRAGPASIPVRSTALRLPHPSLSAGGCQPEVFTR